MKDRTKWILLTIIIFGAFLRFYKLDWGQGLFTHPDEYHIIISVNQLSFPNQMNPHFFNYGTVIIYPIYFTKLLLSSINHELPTINLFLIGRFYSALFSTLTILLIYLISKKFMPKTYALMAAALTALTPGLIQQAHFLTPESAMIFFILGSLYFLIQYTEKSNLKFLIPTSVFFGLALATKISSAIFVIPIIISIASKESPWNLQGIKKTAVSGSLLAVSILAALFLTSPFIFLDFPSFWQSFRYEQGLATGHVMVFYTRQFIDTIPILFQFEKIYPYALGPALLVSGVVGFFLMTYSAISAKQNRPFHLLLTTCYLILFLPNAFLFAKWTRFLSPTFPFFAIFSAFLLFQIKSLKILKYLNLPILALTTFSALAFFSIYIRDDVRVTANNWIKENTPPGSTFFVEEGNTIEVPFQGNFVRLSANFYDYENNPQIQRKINLYLSQADYFVIESRRIFMDHKPKMFPKTARFYDDLFTGKLGFREIKIFTSYPLFPDENAEETWSVFDHPVIRVFKKV